MERRRVIDLLRGKYPECTWTWNPELWRWENDRGWNVTPHSEFAPQYDGDDDTFVTVYYRSDTRTYIPLRTEVMSLKGTA